MISGDVGSRKPDAGIFAAFLDRAGRPTADCLLVDDRAANLEVVARLGFQTIRFGEPKRGGGGEPPAVPSFAQLRDYLMRFA